MSENQNMLIHDISSRYVGFISDDANDSLCDIILTLDLLSFLSSDYMFNFSNIIL